jgi:hypothetical protein
MTVCKKVSMFGIATDTVPDSFNPRISCFGSIHPRRIRVVREQCDSRSMIHEFLDIFALLVEF